MLRQSRSISAEPSQQRIQISLPRLLGNPPGGNFAWPNYKSPTEGFPWNFQEISLPKSYLKWWVSGQSLELDKNISMGKETHLPNCLWMGYVIFGGRISTPISPSTPTRFQADLRMICLRFRDFPGPKESKCQKWLKFPNCLWKKNLTA